MGTYTRYNNLVELYENSVKAFASHNLFGVKKNGRYEWLTYADFGKQVDAFRSALEQIGVGPGDTVAIIANNRVEWAVGAYATYGRGACYCPMYEAQLYKDWEYIVRDSATKVLLVASFDIYTKVLPMLEEVETLERVIFFDGDKNHEDSYAKMLERGAEAPSDALHPDKGDIAGFIYTSGTTGKPKGVLLSHDNMCYNVWGVLSKDLVDPHDTSLAFLPWAHSFGQNCELHPMIALGASMGLVEDVTTIVQNMGEVRPTLLFAVPRIFNKIYDGISKKMEDESPTKRKIFRAAMQNAEARRQETQRGGVGFMTGMKDKVFDKLVFSKVRERFGGRLRYAVSGGAALAPEVARFMDSLHIPVCEGYGLTETSPIISVNTPGATKIGSVGKLLDGVTVRIDPVEGYEEGVGEICAAGPNIMQGYHNLPDKTAEVMTDDGYFRTGDLGSVDGDGFLWIKGRVKEQYKLENGKYVVPGPIEEVLALSPYILQCMLEGTNRPYNVALVVLDMPAIEKWAAANSVSLDGDINANERVRQLIKEELASSGDGLKGYERPKDAYLLTEEWTTDNGMLTPKMSLKRRVALQRFGDHIASLYS